MKDRITLRFLAAPGDAGPSGDTVQAGSVLEWIDKAGYACAAGWSGSACVTAYVGNIHFTRPVRPGEVVEVEARIIHTGRTSMHIRVAVASSDARVSDFSITTHCILVFVAVDAAGRPTTVPVWKPGSVEDLELSENAVGRIEARKEIHREMRAQRYSDEGTGPRTVFRFLAAPSVVNFGGNAHGGTVMRWIDEAASTCAAGWVRRDVVAVYSGGIHFYRPIHIGDVVEVESRLIHTGRTSMHVATHVRSGSPFNDDRQLTTLCMSVFVAKGADGKATPVPSLPLVSEEDARLSRHAERLIEMRAALRSIPAG